MTIVKEKIDRESILAAGTEEFCKSGFHGTSIASIAALLGCTKARIYRHFETKEALFIEVIQRATYRQSPSMMNLLCKSAESYLETTTTVQVDFCLGDSEYSLKETLINFGEYVLNAFHTPQSLALQRMVIAATIHSDAGYTYYENGPAKAIDSLRQFFSDHMDAGFLRKTDARVAACHYYGLLQSEIYQVGIFNVVTSIQPSITRVIVSRAVDIFLKGYEQIAPISSKN